MIWGFKVGVVIPLKTKGSRRLEGGDTNGVWDSEWRHIELGVFLALVAVVVHGLVDVPYFKNDLSFEFWVLLGLAWAGRRWSSGVEPVSSATRPET
jgi:hypothetical protein